MQNSGFISSDIDFSSSQVSQVSNFNFNFELKNMKNFDTDQTFIINTISDGSDSVKDYNQSGQRNTNQLVKKLNVKDLEVNKENGQKLKVSNKENNIPNQGSNQAQTQSRKIIIHKNPSSISPYRNSQAVDESFRTNKIVQLQEELITVRKEMGLKESGWIKEKSMLMGKMEMVNLQMAEMRQRNNNLIQINQTLTEALGQSAKNEMIGEYEKRIQDMGKELAHKNKKIQALQESVSKIEKQKVDFSLKQKQDRERIEHLSKTLEEYKQIVKESNERKFESDEKIVLITKNVQNIKAKLNQLPIKNQYLKPVFLLLNTLFSNGNANQQFRSKSDYENKTNHIDKSCIIGFENNNNLQSLNISSIGKPFETHQPTTNNKHYIQKTNKKLYDQNTNNKLYIQNAKKPHQVNNHPQQNNQGEQQSLINQLYHITSNQFNHQQQNFRQQNFNTNIYNNHEQNSQSRYMKIYQRQRIHQNQHKNTSFYIKNQNHPNEHSYYDNCNNNNNQIKRNNTFHNILLDQQNVKRIDTSQDQYEDYQGVNQIQYNPYPDNNSNNLYQNNNNLSYSIEPQDQQQQVYLCEVCHRVYSHQQFLNHMKQCQQYQALLQQKRLIQSKLISINQIDYQNRKSHNNSLNSSAIVLNKSRSKTKVIKPAEQPIMAGRPSNNNKNRQTNHNRQGIPTNIANQRGDYTNRKENLTERYIRRDEHDDGLQMSELMNSSGISSRLSNIKLDKQQKQSTRHTKPLISPNKYYKPQTNPHNYNHSNYQTQYLHQEDLDFVNHFNIMNNHNNNRNNNYKNNNIHNNKFKGISDIKYQTNIHHNKNHNVGKESMQEEIRKIVEAINQGKSTKNRPDSFSNKFPNHKAESIRKQFPAKTHKSKQDFY